MRFSKLRSDEKHNEAKRVASIIGLEAHDASK